jgi:uncharacterized protein YjbI with pentapeptide repeats
LRGTDVSGAALWHTSLDFADLSGADLSSAKVIAANLRGTDVSGAALWHTSLDFADLSGADLSSANLTGASLNSTHLIEARLINADLNRANLMNADLTSADLNGGLLFDTIFGKVDLTETNGLDKCNHRGPSTIDFRTLSQSKNLPISFLRGCGLPENLIDYLPLLRGEAIQFYSCFISYSAKDQSFAERLHADLQSKGVRCWFAPHDLPVGAKIWDAIDEAIRLREKLLLILSKASIASEWVEDEVTRLMPKSDQEKRSCYSRSV